MTAPEQPKQPEHPGEAWPADGCDCHVHVIGDPMRHPMVPQRHYTPGPASVAALRHHLDGLGLRRAVIVQPSVYGSDNRCLLESLEQLAGAGRGVAVPADDAAPAELRRLHAAGVRGMRLNLESSGNQDVATLERLLVDWSSRIADLGWHLQLYAAADVVDRIAGRLATLPVKVVLDHFALVAGAPGTPGAGTVEDLLRSGRVLVKLSAPYRLPSPALADAWARAFLAAAPEAVLWGSDWPHTARRPGAGAHEVSPYRDVPPDTLAADLRTWLPTAEARARVLRDNPATLYDF